MPPSIAPRVWALRLAAGVAAGVAACLTMAGAAVVAPARAQDAPAAHRLPPDTAQWVMSAAGAGRFALATNGRVAPIVVSDGDWPAVVRVAGDLRADLARVSGATPVLTVGRRPAGARQLVVVGTLGRSPLVDSLVRAGRLDAAGVAGAWEAWTTQVVERPFPGVARALVIAGSDRRGTVYGAYDLSARIGVSPWHWWADVPVPRRPELHVLPGRHGEGPPAVRYRGIFINDEAPAFAGWARAKFGGVNAKAYAHVFELLLRLRGNYLWPAMWGHAFAVDDTLSPQLADAYGVVMGTSHHEPMTRAHSEWARFGQGPWDYARNDSALRAFWRAGIRRLGGREHLVTLGMRGDGDEPMTEGTAVALLERIVADQRRILAEETGRPAERTPQLWALYKEVQNYYDRGMRVPDDVTLLFADDNWGNLRRLPGAANRARAGGAGVYYHFDYVGGPRNYKWLNTNPIARVWEQLHLAHEAGADRVWIVNVGDLKPMELPISFFLDYAWDPTRWPAGRLPEWTRRWVAQQFPAGRSGRAPAAHDAVVSEIADLVTTYGMWAGRRKPELLDTATYSLAHHAEAERVVAGWDSLEARALRARDALPAAAHDAYFQLVLHPIQAYATLQRLYVTAARNRQHAREGRATTNALAAEARRLFARDAALGRWYNDSLAGGKWAHMMDQTHVGYTSWQEPPRDVMPRVDEIRVPDVAELGVTWEGDEGPRAAPPGGSTRPAPPTLPELDAWNQQATWLELYARGTRPAAYAVHAGAPWLRVGDTTGDSARGQVRDAVRLPVRVDWARVPVGTHRVPVGTHRVPITVTGDGRRQVVHAVVRRPAGAPPAAGAFVQGQGVVAIEAEHFARAVGDTGVRWQVIPGFGRTRSGVTPLPATAPARTPGGGAPHLAYRVHLLDSGTVRVHLHLSPTLDVFARGGLRYAVSLDDEAPQVVNVHADGSSDGRTDGNRAWERGVMDGVKVHVTTHQVRRPGEHVVRVWMVDAGLVLQRVVLDVGGLRPSYLGPPESRRGGDAPGAAVTDAVTDAARAPDVDRR